MMQIMAMEKPITLSSTIELDILPSYIGLGVEINLEINKKQVPNAKKNQKLRCLDMRALGIELVIDDIGTGYFSLSYLRRPSCTFSRENVHEGLLFSGKF
jgi:predicted signal transduction protein with EAL and GGDEF domain